MYSPHPFYIQVITCPQASFISSSELGEVAEARRGSKPDNEIDRYIYRTPLYTLDSVTLPIQ